MSLVDRLNPDTLIAGVIIGTAITLLGVGIYVSYVEVYRARCLNAGYTGAAVTWTLRGYCVQHDRVVPVEQIK